MSLLLYMTQGLAEFLTKGPNHYGTVLDTCYVWKTKKSGVTSKSHPNGTGITPLDDTSATNLHVQILEEFPWYDDLTAILERNPVISLKTVSSAPGMDHAANYFLLIQESTSVNSQPSSSTQYGGYVPSTHPSPLSVQPTSPMATYRPIPSPLNQDDRRMDYGDDNIMNLNSAPRHETGHKCQLPPSSPLHPPCSSLVLPEKPETTLHNSHAIFSTPDPMRHTTLILMLISPMTQSVAPEKGNERPLEKTYSEILSQVGLINDEIENLQSDRLDKASCEELKNNHYIAKLNLT
ncbi:uncharacterized protein BJ212DRAFT_1296684 [Suillus subaureus]|uniref:Uncharacterized protein n=1 Tax=Suillus subaureus TaxID=48587 RepID=A0A9P7EIF7_9AGAM|nr:uncharacterized protein BJ212DRAFT_1296684 [Suillus subaureus]KAG1822694.1 hypothetical protein BJ212DRAFT_1296684 [Suillus subaureus]